MMIKEKQYVEFERLAKPLIDFLHENFHPHAKIVIDWNGAELSEGSLGVPYKNENN